MPKKCMDAALQEKSIPQALLKHSIQEQEVVIRRLEAATRGVLKKKMFLENSENSQENTCGSLFLIRPATLLKKRLWRRCFLVNFTKFLRTTFLQNTSRRLLLEGVHLLKIPGNYL